MNHKIYKKEIFIYISLTLIAYFSIIFGFFQNEDLAGGAMQDFNFYIGILNNFRDDFLFSFLNYKELGSDHSPFFVSLLTLVNIPLGDLNIINTKELKFDAGNALLEYGNKYTFLRFIYLHICLLTPVIFYKCLKIIYKDTKNITLFFLSILILFSPHFRAYSIWAGETNLALLFLLISIYFYLRLVEETYKNKKKYFLLIFLNIFFMAMAAHARPIYCLISIFFFLKYLQIFKFKTEIIQFILLNIIFAFPAFYYFVLLDNYPFVLYSNFFYNPSLTLYSTNIILSSSIIFFYCMPFLIVNFKNNKFLLNKKNIFLIIISLLLSFILLQNFQYNEMMGGGGIFYQISNKIFGNNYFLYFISILSIYFVITAASKSLNDFMLLFIIICFDPDPWIYHKSFEPILFCLLLTLFDNKNFKNLNSNNEKNISTIVSVYYLLVFFLYVFIRS